MRPAIELPSADLSHQRVRLKITSSALKASPFVPGHALANMQHIFGGVVVHVPASRAAYGSKVNSRVYLTSGSRNWRMTLAISGQSASARILLLLDEHRTLITPPFFGS
jgi:hypothetical protein